LKTTAIAPAAPLPEEHRARRIDRHGQSDRRQQRRQDEKANQCKHKIKESLDPAIRSAIPRTTCREDRRCRPALRIRRDIGAFGPPVGDCT
jgi:hypothetical protein